MQYCTFRGRVYRVAHRRQKKVWGTCDPPTHPGKTIYLDPNPVAEGRKVPKGSDALWLAIHEGLHACLWDLDEEAIDSTAVSLTNFLHRLGYRRASGPPSVA